MATAMNVPRGLSVGDLLDDLDRAAATSCPEGMPDALALALRHVGDHVARLCTDDLNRPLDERGVGSSAGEGGLQGRAHDVTVGLDAGP